jgi:ammonia channel protein AmtB
MVTAADTDIAVATAAIAAVADTEAAAAHADLAAVALGAVADLVAVDAGK